MRKQCDFSIGFDNEIEEISMYPNNHLSKKMIENILNDCIDDNTLPVCERCEGSVHYETKGDRIVIRSKSCVEVGEDWNKDKWSKNDDIDFPTNRIRR
jgi:hypothetical protein